MPKKIHNDTYCRQYKDKVLPDEKGNCSLCGADLAPIIFEDGLVYLLKRGALYAIEPKGSVSYKTEYREALKVSE